MIAKKNNQFIMKIKTPKKQTALSLVEKCGQKFQCFWKRELET
jgi:hypothetical protein